MPRLNLCLILAVCVCSMCNGGTRIDTEPKIVLFDGKSIPAPPLQGIKWEIPKSRLPDNLLTATDILFSQGLADPRGCEYCVTEVAVGNVWNGGGLPIRRTHGRFQKTIAHSNALLFAGMDWFIRPFP